MQNHYNPTVHWKAQFFFMHKNEAGYETLDILSELLRPIAEKEQPAEFALYAAMLFLHHLLLCTKKRNGGFVNETISKQLDVRNQGQLVELFPENKALTLRIKSFREQSKWSAPSQPTHAPG